MAKTTLILPLKSVESDFSQQHYQVYIYQKTERKFCDNSKVWLTVKLLSLL